jgi:hypothetical protein
VRAEFDRLPGAIEVPELYPSVKADGDHPEAVRTDRDRPHPAVRGPEVDLLAGLVKMPEPHPPLA